jgi:hypothetical protein
MRNIRTAIVIASCVMGASVCVVEPAWAASVCLGPKWSDAPKAQRTALQKELRDRGAIGAKDKLDGCTPPSGLNGKPDPKKKAACVKNCDKTGDVVTSLCSIGSAFLPGALIACEIAKAAFKPLCTQDCGSRFGALDQPEQSRVAVNELPQD